MSTERLTVPGLGTVETVLAHDLLGTEVRRTKLAVASMVGLTASIVVSYAGQVVSVGGAPLETYTWLFDVLSAVIIVAVVATLTVLPIVYAGWNGGPALAFAIPLVPVVVAGVLSRRYVLDLDAAIALTVGAVGASVAIYAGHVRETGSTRPWRARRIDEDVLLFVTGVVTCSFLASVSFARTAPAHVLEWYVPFGVLWIVPAVIGCAYWGIWVRSTVGSERDRPQSTPDRDTREDDREQLVGEQ